MYVLTGRAGYLVAALLLLVAAPSAAILLDRESGSENGGTCPHCHHHRRHHHGRVKANLIDHDTIVVLGSSVAWGQGAGDGLGWVEHLAASVKQLNPKRKFMNLAVPGYTIKRSKKEWNDPSEFENASAVIIGLSLGNEGFASIAGDTEKSANKQAEMRDYYLTNLKGFAESFTVPVLLGGVYPNGGYDDSHEKHLQECNRVMKTWRFPMFDFLSATDDGHGKWKDGMMSDAYHPNAEGHMEMAQAITGQEMHHLLKREGKTRYRDHPNDKGHALMAQSILQKQIDMLAGLD
jgi:lysophospholipase L1-like esterase